MVQDLEFAHAFVGGIHILRRTDADTVVHAFLQEAELEPIDEVPVLLVRVQVAGRAVIGRYQNGTVHDGIAFQVAVPLGEVAAVEEHLEAAGLLFRREFTARGRFRLQEHLVDLVHGIAVVGIAGGSEQGAGLAQGRLQVVVIDFLRALGGNLLHGIRGRITYGGIRIVQRTGGEEEGLHKGHVSQFVECEDPERGILGETDRLRQAQALLVGILLIGREHVDIPFQGSGIPLFRRSQKIRDDGRVVHREKGRLRGGILSGQAAQDLRRPVRADMAENRIEAGGGAGHERLDTGHLIVGRERMDGRCQGVLERRNLRLGSLCQEFGDGTRILGTHDTGERRRRFGGSLGGLGQHGRSGRLDFLRGGERHQVIQLQSVLRRLHGSQDGPGEVSPEGFEGTERLRSPGGAEQGHQRVAGRLSADLTGGTDGRLTQFARRIQLRKDQVQAHPAGTQPVHDIRLRSFAQFGEPLREHRLHGGYAISVSGSGNGGVPQRPVPGAQQVPEHLEAFLGRRLVHDHFRSRTLQAGTAVPQDRLGGLDGLLRRDIPQGHHIIGRGIRFQPAEGSFASHTAEGLGDGIFLHRVGRGSRPTQEFRFGFPPFLVRNDIGQDGLRGGLVADKIQDGILPAQVRNRRHGGRTGKRVVHILPEQVDILRSGKHPELGQQELAVHRIGLGGDSFRESFPDRIPVLHISGNIGCEGRQGILHEGVRALFAEPCREQFHRRRGGSGQVLHILRKSGGIAAGHHGQDIADHGFRRPATGILTKTEGGADKRQDYQGNYLFHRARSWMPRAHAWAG